jgi:ribosomal protein S18 acetylase RimI-like enzyme
LLEALELSGDDQRFHPHPFTDAAVQRLAEGKGKDYYCVLVEDGRVVGYGMLRGWDEGYDVPSLGIAVHPAARRRGLAGRLMRHLHEQARARGASRVRLKVLEDNSAAIALYEALGYRFDDKDGHYLVGMLPLGS